MKQETGSDRQLAAIVAFTRRLRLRLVAVEAGAALLQALALGLLLGLAAVCAEHLLHPGPFWRTALVLAAPAASILAAGLTLYSRLRGRLSYHRVGLLAESDLEALRGRLILALELAAVPAPDRRRLTGSPGLTDAAVQGAAACIEGRSTGSIVGWNPLRLPARQLAAAAVAVIASGALFAEDLVPAAKRCAHPLREHPRLARTLIEVRPPQLEVVKGEDAAVEILFSGKVPRTAEILRRDSESADWQATEIAPSAGADADTVRYSFTDVVRPFSFSVRGGDGFAGPYDVEVIDPPEVRQLTIHYRYPPHCGWPERVEPGNGDVSAPAGTEVEIRIDASKPLSEAALVIDDTLRLPAEVEDRGARVSFSLPVATGPSSVAATSATNRRLYYVDLMDRKGISNRDPIRYAIEVLPDQKPRVAIVEPGEDIDLPESKVVGLGIEGSDDFGIASLELLFRKNGGSEGSTPLSLRPGPRVVVDHLWDLAPLDLLPEDRVTYRVRATDNDAVTGPKSSYSKEFAVRFQSMFELLDEVSEQQSETVMSVEELIDQERSARQYLEQVRREVLKTEELSWEQKRELEAALDRERERAQALEEAAQELAEVAKKLSEQGLGSRELLDKMEEIRELMEEIASPELLEALRELEQSAGELDPEQLAETLKKFSEEYEVFEQRLDRTLALLRQVQAEQQLDAAVEKARDLLARQERIDEELASASEAAARLEALEESLARDSERLRGDLEEAAGALTPISPGSSEALSREAAEMEQRDLAGRMREMAASLGEGRHQHARSLGKGLEEDLGELAADLENLRDQFSAEERGRLVDQLRAAMAGLIDLSHSQEELSRRTRRERDGAAAAALADEQFALLRGTDAVISELASAGQQTLSLDRAVVVTTGYARRRMQESGRRLGQREAGQSLPSQSEAYGYLNEAANLLRRSIEDVASSFMPSGFAEAMEKLMGLSEQQAALNQATREAIEGQEAPGRDRGGSGRGANARAEMGRLAAEQRSIMQALSEIERSLRGHRGAEKRMQGIAAEMKGVLRDMQQGRPHPRINQAQERIYQRMLDASRSIYSRGFKKKRQSETGADSDYAGPMLIPDDLGQRPDHWREAMKRALAGNLPREYRELVRRYYESVYADIAARPDSLEGLP